MKIVRKDLSEFKFGSLIYSIVAFPPPLIMTSVKFLFMIVYFYRIFLFFNCQSIFIVWICMEINLLLMLILFYLDFLERNKFELINMCLFYLMIQGLGSFLYLFSCYFVRNLELETLNNIIVALALSLKIGLFPFHYWFFKLVKSTGSSGFFLLISMQKIPLLLLLFHLNEGCLFIFLFINILRGCIILFNSVRVEDMLISSSIYIVVWIIFTYKLDLSVFLIFFLNYSLLIYLYRVDILHLKYLPSSFKSIFPIVLLLFLMGLPPLRFFFFKYTIIFNLIHFYSVTLIVLIWALGFFSLIGYTRIIFPYLFSWDGGFFSWKNETLFRIGNFFLFLFLFWFLFN